MKLSAKVDPRITSWMEKKRKKYIGHDTQNKIIRLMAFIIFYSIMVDEVTDCSNKEQFIISFRWVDIDFDTHRDFIGIYNVDNIKADFYSYERRFDYVKHPIIKCSWSVLQWCKEYVWY